MLEEKQELEEKQDSEEKQELELGVGGEAGVGGVGGKERQLSILCSFSKGTEKAFKFQILAVFAELCFNSNLNQNQCAVIKASQVSFIRRPLWN